MRIAAVAVVLAAAALAACSTTTAKPAVTKSVSKSVTTVTGVETFTGRSAAKAATITIPLTASGVITDTGHVTLGGSSGPGKGFLVFTKGKLRVYHSRVAFAGLPPNRKTCAVTGVGTGTFRTVVGSTGEWAGATGYGTYKVTFSGTQPRLRNGKCNVSQNVPFVRSKPQLTVFTATGTLTIRKAK